MGGAKGLGVGYRAAVLLLLNEEVSCDYGVRGVFGGLGERAGHTAKS